MATARQVITSALTFRLNRLGVGEVLDADTGAVCLAALNEIGDEWSSGSSMLFQEVFVTGVCNGTTGTLGTTWPGIATGEEILGATVSYGAGFDKPIDWISLAQYADIGQKSTASIPQFYAVDGASTVYFWPAASGQTITLRVKQSAAVFADLDTSYTMPQGYAFALAACLAERLAPVMLGGITPAIANEARRARMMVMALNTDPAIVDAGSRRYGNILSGFY